MNLKKLFTCLVVVGLLAPTVFANLITDNPSFEQPAMASGTQGGSPTDWYYHAYNASSGGAVFNTDGTASFSGGARDGSQLVYGRNYRLHQTTGVQMVEGVQYTLTLWNHADTVDYTGYSFNSIGGLGYATGPNDNQYTDDLNMQYWLNTGGWQQLTMHYTATAADVGNYLVVICGDGNSSGTTSVIPWTAFDDMVLTPEPATIAVLSIGGLLTLVRRRRRA